MDKTTIQKVAKFVATYLNTDCQKHLKAHGEYIIDSGKVETAIIKALSHRASKTR